MESGGHIIKIEKILVNGKEVYSSQPSLPQENTSLIFVLVFVLLIAVLFYFYYKKQKPAPSSRKIKHRRKRKV